MPLTGTVNRIQYVIVDNVIHISKSRRSNSDGGNGDDSGSGDRLNSQKYIMHIVQM